MTKTEKYIQFAIDNNYTPEIDKDITFFRSIRGGKICFVNEYNKNEYNLNFTETITSKPFIEAIARGIRQNDKLMINFMNKHFESPFIQHISGLEKEEKNKILMYELITYITTEQAFAIRDGELEEFIINIT